MCRYIFLALLALPLSVGAADVAVSGRVSVRDGDKSLDIGFSSRDKSAIEDYYKGREGRKKKDKHGERGMPPGLAKRGGDLPPGLAKRGSLPPGLAKRDRLPADVAYEPLPRDLEAKLPPLPSRDYIRVKVGKDLVILDQKTRVVLDVAYGLGD